MYMCVCLCMHVLNISFTLHLTEYCSDFNSQLVFFSGQFRHKQFEQMSFWPIKCIYTACGHHKE